jgi:hypothetical protein
MEHLTLIWPARCQHYKPWYRIGGSIFRVTLIQTLLTPTGIIQVSDRQLTYPDGRVHHEPANKAVIWCDSMVVGFTGMAFTDSSQERSISRWITLALRNAVTIGDAVQSIAHAGSQLMAETDYENKRLTFMFAGIPPNLGYAVGFKLTNYEHIPPPRIPEKHFVYGRESRLPLHTGDMYMYGTAGVHITSAARQKHNDQLRQIHMKYGANHAARRMVAIQRDISNEILRRTRRTTVGRAAMIVSLPATAQSGEFHSLVDKR